MPVYITCTVSQLIYIVLDVVVDFARNVIFPDIKGTLATVPSYGSQKLAAGMGYTVDITHPGTPQK